MMAIVPGSGPLDAEFVVVGEAPGAEEIRADKPFVGPAGKKLRAVMHQCGLDPATVRFENVLETKLGNNDESCLYVNGNKNNPKPELIAAWKSLEHRLSQLENKKVILACGDTAMRALTAETHIGKCQSYVIPCKAGTVIPCYHPAYFLPGRTPHEIHWLTLAIRKAMAVVAGCKDTVQSPIIGPSAEMCLVKLAQYKDADMLSIDIEVDQANNEITCIGIAPSKTEALVIPLKRGSNSYFHTQEELIVTKAIARLFSETMPKLMQNFIFDAMYLARFGMTLSGELRDTMYNAHVLYPELPKSLADLGRMYCYCAPWKGRNDYTSTEGLWRYNALDCMRTFEIWEAQEEEIEGRGLKDFRDKYIKPLPMCVLDICLRGIRVDRGRLREISTSLQNALAALRTELQGSVQGVVPNSVLTKGKRDAKNDKATGTIKTKDEWKVASKEDKAKYVRDRKTGELFEKAFHREPFNPNSSKQTVAYLTACGYDVPVNRKSGNPSVDRESLMKLYRKYGDETLRSLISFKSLSTMHSNYSEEGLVLDDDDRLRWSHSLTETGRLRTSETPWKTGRNIQNFPRKKRFDFKSAFPADDGMVMGNFDLEQAESRIVAYAANDKTMIKIFEDNIDLHQYVADDLTARLGRNFTRQFAKFVNHASSYAMGPTTFLGKCISEGIEISFSECVEVLQARERTFPRVTEWREGLRHIVSTTRLVTTPTGRQRQFFGPLQKKSDGTWSGATEAMFREAFAYIPQSGVADVINTIWFRLRKYEPELQMLLQCHDSLLFQVPAAMQDKYDAIVRKEAVVELDIYGKVIVIPIALAWGPNWGAL